MQKGLLLMVFIGVFCLQSLFAAPDEETKAKLKDDQLVEEKKDPEMPPETQPQIGEDKKMDEEKQETPEERHKKWLESLERLPEDVKNKLQEYYDKYGVEVYAHLDANVSPNLLGALDQFFISKSDTPEAQQALKDWLRNGIHLIPKYCAECEGNAGFAPTTLDDGILDWDKPFSFSLCPLGCESSESYRGTIEHEFAHTITPNFDVKNGTSREGSEWKEMVDQLANQYPPLQPVDFQPNGKPIYSIKELEKRGYFGDYSLKNHAEDFAMLSENAWVYPSMIGDIRKREPSMETKFQRMKLIYASRGFNVPNPNR